MQQPRTVYQQPRMYYPHAMIAGLGVAPPPVPQALTVEESKIQQAVLQEINTASNVLDDNLTSSMQSIMENMTEDVKKEMMKGAIANTVIQGGLAVAVAMAPIPIVGWIIAAVALIISGITTIASMHNQAKMQRILAETQQEAKVMEMAFSIKIREYQGTVILREKKAAIAIAMTRGALPEDEEMLAPPPVQPNVDNTRGGTILDTPDQVIIAAAVKKAVKIETGQLGSPTQNMEGLGLTPWELSILMFFNPGAAAAFSTAATQAAAAASAGATAVASQFAASATSLASQAAAHEAQTSKAMQAASAQMSQFIDSGQQNVAQTIEDTIQRLEEELGLRQRKDNSLEGRVKRSAKKAWNVFDAITNPITQWEMISGETALEEVRKATRALLTEARLKQIVNWQTQKSQMDNPQVRQNMRFGLARSLRNHPTIGNTIRNYWKLQDALDAIKAKKSNPRAIAQAVDVANVVIQTTPPAQVAAAQKPKMPLPVKGGVIAGGAIVLAALLS